MNLQRWFAQHDLVCGSSESPVGVCILWADRGKLNLPVKNSPFYLLGNLYTPRGISRMLRTLCLVPSIRHLILWGPESPVGRTGQLVSSLWNKGVDARHQVRGTEILIDSLIEPEAVERLRQKVQLIDLREAAKDDFSQVLKIAASQPRLEPHSSSRSFPEPATQAPETFPFSSVNYQVRASNVAEALLNILYLVMRYGQVKPTEYGNRQKELLNLSVTVSDEKPDKPKLPAWLPFNTKELKTYYPEITTAPPLGGKAYLYGDRLRKHFGLDQIRQSIISKLQKDSSTRRAVAVTWDVKLDNSPQVTSPPCITQVVANVVNRRLYLTYIARSQEMLKGWPMNTFAMLQLQKEIAAALNLKLGPLTSFTTSAHLYDDDWSRAETLLEKYHRPRPLEFDAAGNFIIKLENDEIILELLSPGEGGEVIWQTKGKAAEDLSQIIAFEHPVLSNTHLLYLGRELQRAETALKSKTPYTQKQA